MDTYRKLLRMAVDQQSRCRSCNAKVVARAERAAMICEVGTEDSCRGMIRFLVYASDDEARYRMPECDDVYRACKSAMEVEAKDGR